MEDAVITVKKISTEENAVDMLTKTPSTKFRYWLELIKMIMA